MWSVIGALAEATTRLALGTGVTCPTIRIHPAIVAQAAATSAAMIEGRFFLGVGTGENLNEHVVGRALAGRSRCAWRCWRRRSRSSACSGRAATRSHHGRYYTVENARLYTLPERAAADHGRGERPPGAPSWPAGSATA